MKPIDMPAAFSSNVARVAIFGPGGAAAAELIRILNRHRYAQIVAAFSSESFALEDVVAARPDVVFLTTPDDVSAVVAPQLVDAGVRVIDLSGAFRLAEPSLYPSWYGFAHQRPELLAQAVYGLPEWCGEQLRNARLVANAGCHPTAVLLALRPLTFLIDRTQPVIVDCKAGRYGAGSMSDAPYSLTELFGNVKAYGVGDVCDDPEIRQRLHLGQRTPLVFVPHLLPAVRGIYSTMYVAFPRDVTAEELAEVYEDAYGRRPFVRVLGAGNVPELRNVVNTPYAEIGFAVLHGGRRAVVVSVIDDLLRGAASQAVQNFNLMFGHDEGEGLRDPAAERSPAVPTHLPAAEGGASRVAV